MKTVWQELEALLGKDDSETVTVPREQMKRLTKHGMAQANALAQTLTMLHSIQIVVCGRECRPERHNYDCKTLTAMMRLVKQKI